MRHELNHTGVQEDTRTDGIEHTVDDQGSPSAGRVRMANAKSDSDSERGREAVTDCHQIRSPALRSGERNDSKTRAEGETLEELVEDEDRVQGFELLPGNRQREADEDGVEYDAKLEDEDRSQLGGVVLLPLGVATDAEAVRIINCSCSCQSFRLSDGRIVAVAQVSMTMSVPLGMVVRVTLAMVVTLVVMVGAGAFNFLVFAYVVKMVLAWEIGRCTRDVPGSVIIELDLLHLLLVISGTLRKAGECRKGECEEFNKEQREDSDHGNGLCPRVFCDDARKTLVGERIIGRSEELKVCNESIVN